MHIPLTSLAGTAIAASLGQVATIGKSVLSGVRACCLVYERDACGSTVVCRESQSGQVLAYRYLSLSNVIEIVVVFLRLALAQDAVSSRTLNLTDNSTIVVKGKQATGSGP